MKRIARLFCVGLTVLLALSGCSENQTPDSIEKIVLTADSFSAMHMSVSDSDVWSSEAKIWKQHSEAYKEFQDSEASPEMQLTLKNKSVALKYKSSWLADDGVLCSEYRSENGNIIARYRNDSGKLYRIIAEENQFNVDKNWTTEQEYLDWLKKVLADFGVTDLSQYDYSCQTHTYVWGDDWAGNDHKDYFYTVKDPTCEELGTYHFNFSKTISGYCVSDRIEVDVRFQSDDSIQVSINLDEGEFENVSEIKLDREKMIQALEEYVNRCVNTDKYQFHSYEITNETLTYKGGKLCYVYTVEVNLTGSAYPDDPFGTVETIGIFCE